MTSFNRYRCLKVFKRIIIGIISAVLAASMLCGCSFFSHDNERDLQQVIATVDSYEITNSAQVEKKDADGNTVKDENGDIVYETVLYKFTTEKKDIYKRDLVEYVSNNYDNLSSSYGNNPEAIYRAGASMLINIELVTNEVDALIDAGKIKWGLTETNAVKKRIYTVIDSTLVSIKNEILASRDQSQITTEGDSEVKTDTTYPVKPSEDAEDVEDAEEWEPDIARYPAMFGDLDKLSLEREAMRRFISLLESRVEDDFRITAEDREKFDEDLKKINETIDTKGVSYVYPMIGQTHLMYYVTGESLEQSHKITLLQEYLTESVSVDDSRVLESYNSLLTSQRSAFTDPETGIAAFDSAMSGSGTVLYFPNTNYFYVKHILLPFSDAQKAELTAYKARLDVTKDDVAAFRDRLVDGIVCYPHVAGEDDKSQPMSVDEVIAEIKTVMHPLQNNARLADLAFDDLIYKYNTDTGAFGNNKGYVVKYELDEGEKETYMQEFADAARDLRKTQAVGQVYQKTVGGKAQYQKVVTDYGVHIMYFASVTEAGEVSLYSYTTPGEVETYFDVLKAPIASALENVAYTKWENNILSVNYNEHSTLYADRMSNLWE